MFNQVEKKNKQREHCIKFVQTNLTAVAYSSILQYSIRFAICRGSSFSYIISDFDFEYFSLIFLIFIPNFINSNMEKY